ncbi:MAG: ABC transporter ATP-binding protein [Candidatus Thermoplasmatota archaeon]|nr:ABC transporter ATP-binding protein [Candidatus Thermoplasmatota archaeon]
MISLSNVTKMYGEKIKVLALNNVSLQVDRGEFVSIMGPSGSGKTTLLNIIGCLDKPTEGKYILDGKEIDRLSRSELSELRGREMGFVFQSFNLIPTLTALENVELPLYLTDRPDRERCLKLLNDVRLSGLEGRRPDELSAGQQQRVAIARALANNPEIILGDEITGNMDSKTGEEIMDLLKELNRGEDKTIIIVTHNASMAYGRIVRIEDGRINEPCS